MTLPSFLAALLPLIVTPITGRDGKLPLWARLIIAIIVTLIGAICWALYVNALTPGNIGIIVWSAVIYVGVLASGPLKPLYGIASPAIQRLWQWRPWSAYTPEEDNGHPAYPTGTYPATRQGALPDQPTRPMPSQPQSDDRDQP